MKINSTYVKYGFVVVAVVVAFQSFGATVKNLLGASTVIEPSSDPQAEYLQGNEFNSGVELQNALFGFDYRPNPTNRGYVQVAFDREVAKAFADLEQLRQTDGTACSNTGHRFACASDAIANNLKKQVDKAVDAKDCNVSQDGEPCQYQIVALDKNGKPVEATPVSANLVAIVFATRAGAVQMAAAGDDFPQVAWDYGTFFTAVNNLQQAQKTLLQETEAVAIGEVE